MGDDSKTFAALAYLIPIFGGIVVFLVRKGDYERFHAMQSILFWVGAILLSIVIDIIGAIFGIIPVVGKVIVGFIDLIRLLAGLGIVILWLMLMWKTFIGEKLELPFISQQSRKMKGQAAKTV